MIGTLYIVVWLTAAIEVNVEVFVEAAQACAAMKQHTAAGLYVASRPGDAVVTGGWPMQPKAKPSRCVEHSVTEYVVEPVE